MFTVKFSGIYYEPSASEKSIIFLFSKYFPWVPRELFGIIKLSYHFDSTAKDVPLIAYSMSFGRGLHRLSH